MSRWFVLVLLLLVAGDAVSALTYYTDGAETGTYSWINEPFGNAQGTYSAVRAHTGAKSISITAGNGGIRGYEITDADFARGPVCVTTWFYDDGQRGYTSDLRVGEWGIRHLHLGIDDFWCNDGVGGSALDTKYCYTIPNTAPQFKTSISRSVGWHEARMQLNTRTNSMLFLDGQLVWEGTHNPLVYARVVPSVVSGSDSKTAYFDDVVVDDCTTPVPPTCTPTTEVCDGVDNDCDNQIDENAVCSPPPSTETMSLSMVRNSVVTQWTCTMVNT